MRAAGNPTLDEGTGAVAFAPAVAVGDTWLLHALWHELGLVDAFRGVLRRHRRQFDAEHLLRVMVFNRLCEPDSKLGILRWLQGARVPDVDSATITHQHLLRTMDTLDACTGALGSALSKQLRPLLDQELSVVFYDLSTIRFEGTSESPEEIRRYGPSKDGGITRQVLLGLVQTAEGWPIHHEVFEGNAAETHTLVPTIEKVLGCYPIRRVVLVADRGLLSLDNLQGIGKIKIGDRPLEFALAVPARRYGDFQDILSDLHATTCSQADEEVTEEFAWQGYRLIAAHRPDLAREQGRRRDEQIGALQEDAARWTGKRNAQDEGKRHRGRKLSDGGVTARFYRAVCDARLAHLIKVDLSSDVFCYDLDEQALTRVQMLDGKLILVTDMADHGPEQIVQRYKALADIEGGFRVLKSEIAPVFHRRADRIRAHALICSLALVLYRVLRMRLKDRHSPYSPQRVLEIMRRIQFHRVTMHQNETASGLSTLTPGQRDLFGTIDLPKPSANHL